MSNTSIEPTTPETDEQSTGGTPEPQSATEPAEATSAEPENFSRAYVEELRQEAAKHRTNAKKSDELARRLVGAYVETTGRLHDARDLTFSDDLMGDDGYPDPTKVTAAVVALIKERPHLAKIRPVGDVGQGVASQSPTNGAAAFGDLLRGAAR